MTAERLIKLLDQFDTKLATAASQAKQAKDHAQQALDLIETVRQEILQVKKQVVSTAVTQVTPALPDETK